MLLKQYSYIHDRVYLHTGVQNIWPRNQTYSRTIASAPTEPVTAGAVEAVHDRVYLHTECTYGPETRHILVPLLLL